MIYAKDFIVISGVNATSILFLSYLVLHLLSMLVFILCAARVHNRLIIPAVEAVHRDAAATPSEQPAA